MQHSFHPTALQPMHAPGQRFRNPGRMNHMHASGETFDNPERMMFYALVGGIISWSVIGIFGWAIWTLIG